MRRLRIDHRDDLDGNSIVCLCENGGRGIGKPDLRGPGGHLFDSVARTLTADDLYVDAGILVVAFLESDIVIGVSAVEAEIGNECDVVRRVYRPAWDNETNERNNRGASDRLHVGHGCISHLGLRNRRNLDPYRSITPVEDSPVLPLAVRTQTKTARCTSDF